MAEEIRCVAFGGEGIGMPKMGLGNVLENQAFLDFQRKFITPHGTIISLSNFADPNAAISNIKSIIKKRYPECTNLLIQVLKRKAAETPISHYKGGIHRIVTNDQNDPFF